MTNRPSLFRLLLALSVLALLMTSTVALAALPAGGTFEDDDGHQFEGSIEALVAAGLTRGCSWEPMLYCPDDPVTRAELATFLLRAADATGDLPEPVGVFVDVPVDAWYAAYVERAVALGFMGAYDGNTFRPEEPAIRAAAAMAIVRMLGEETGIPTGMFADVPSNVPWAASVERLYEIDVVNGCSVDPLSFCPLDELTRGELAAFIQRALNLDPIHPGERPTTTTTTTLPDEHTTTTCPPG